MYFFQKLPKVNKELAQKLLELEKEGQKKRKVMAMFCFQSLLQAFVPLVLFCVKQQTINCGGKGMPTCETKTKVKTCIAKTA